MTIVIAGGTGFLGGAVSSALAQAGHRVTVLTRSADTMGRRAGQEISFVAWDGKRAGPWHAAVAAADVVLNFTGESIGSSRWTRLRKERLLHSRVDPLRALVAALGGQERKASVLISASGVGYYGSVAGGRVTEESPRGSDFLALLCEEWERAASDAERFGVRVVLMRCGVVLARGGEALEKILLPFKFFVGGPLGSGRQWLSWVHRGDVVSAVEFLLAHPEIRGAVNVTSPEPVMMGDLARALARATGRPAWAPVPAGILRILLGEMADTVLTGQPAVPERLLKAGFRFTYPTLESALRSILQTSA